MKIMGEILKRLVFYAVLIVSWPYALFIERNRIRIKRHTVFFDNLPEEFSGFTLLVFADLHHGSLTPLRWVDRVIRRANSAGADMIVCLGDYVKSRGSEIPAVWPLLLKLEAPEGVLMVLGNHDHQAGAALSLKHLEESGRSIRHASIIVRKGAAKIAVAGAGDNWSERSGIDAALKGLPDDMFRVVLAHNPDTADEERAARVDLYICGHTHGGQFILPFLDNSFLIPVRNRNYTRGFRKNGKGETIFIATGLGWSVLPFRFNCPPELSLVEIRRKA